MSRLFSPEARQAEAIVAGGQADRVLLARGMSGLFGDVHIGMR